MSLLTVKVYVDSLSSMLESFLGGTFKPSCSLNVQLIVGASSHT